MKIRMLKEMVYSKGGTVDVVLKKGEIHDAMEHNEQFYIVNANGRNRFVKKTVTEIVTEQSIVPGVSPDQPVVYNEKGGGQSKSPYRMDLVDPKSILEIASVLKEGAEKYGDDNWKLISTQDHLNHLLVHVYAHLAGDESDKHLAHAACRAIFALGVELEDK